METTQPPLQISDESITPDFMENSSNIIENEININNTVTRQRRNIFGKVVNIKNEPIYLVEVKNLSNSSDNTTYTNSNGEFIIFASPEDNVRISKERFRTKTIKLTMNENYTLEKRFPHLPIIFGVIFGSIYLAITFTFIGIGASLRKKETDKYKRNTLLAFIILSLPFIPFQPVFLVVLIVLCALYHKELKEDNSQIPTAVPVINGQKQNLIGQGQRRQSHKIQNIQRNNINVTQGRQRQNGQNPRQNQIGQRQNGQRQNGQSLLGQSLLGQSQNRQSQNRQNIQRNNINVTQGRQSQFQNIPVATQVKETNNYSI
jgi:hypothetical protein